MTDELRKILIENDYFQLTEVPGKGVCALSRMLYTVGLCVDLNATGYKGRYCFPNLLEAMVSISTWDGSADPPGNWIKFKSSTAEYLNPNYEQDT